jgi:hypothetical protein
MSSMGVEVGAGVPPAGGVVGVEVGVSVGVVAGVVGVKASGVVAGVVVPAAGISVVGVVEVDGPVGRVNMSSSGDRSLGRVTAEGCSCGIVAGG